MTTSNMKKNSNRTLGRSKEALAMQYYLTGNNKETWIDKAAKAQILKDRYYSRNDWFLVTVDGGVVYNTKSALMV